MALTQHVFISYADKDGKKYRDRLIRRLKQAGFGDSEYWYDKRDIEPGEEWREAIDKALSESFIVIVILTPGAVESHSVTYEWARALGDGLKVIPLVFKELPKDLKHPLVDRKHWVDCIKKRIPDTVIKTVKTYSETPPDLRYLNKLIMEEMMLFRILSRVSLWLYPYSYSGLVGQDQANQLIEETLDETSRLFSAKLVDIVVTKWS